MRSYLSMSIRDFLREAKDTLLLQLINSSSGFDIQDSQKIAWEKQILILQNNLHSDMNGRIVFEFIIPRVGKRVDVVLVFSEAIFVLEFKTNAEIYNNADKDQTLDYALDLKNFHETSHNVPIVPVLIATSAEIKNQAPLFYADGVANIELTNGLNLKKIISDYSALAPSELQYVAIEGWEHGRYKPTPTIIEAARALYEGHSVKEISRSEAGVQNLTLTSNYVHDLIEKAKSENSKIVCFITGVPGSGKTLAGLNIATNALQVSENRDGSVFLSGNGPLVEVLQEALARNQIKNAKSKGLRPPTKSEALRKSRSFVQIIHRWRDEYLVDASAPEGRIVVFDEAQRAWTLEQTSAFMRTKKAQADFSMSEPEYLLSVMARHEGWCAVICLIGGGQEINKGEAGIDEWLKAANASETDWKLHVSDRLNENDYFTEIPHLPSDVRKDSRLHLATSVRSFRAEALSDFVAAVLNGDVEAALSIKSSLSDYPMLLSRNIDEVKYWLKKHARGTERYGLVASSNAIRLKPEGIHIKSSIEPAMWFLNGKEDVRSSYSLEDAATEFDIQGLELDWVGMCWDANLMWYNSEWRIRRFSGTKWQSINDKDKLKYIVNSYRVLLTRARQGIAIFVPHGSQEDQTRNPDFYDGTYYFLRKCMGLK